MIFSNLRQTSCATAGIYDIEVAGIGIFAGTGEDEATGVGGDATTVVTEATIAGTIGLLLCGVIPPPLFDSAADVTFTGVFLGLKAGVFVKIPDS